MVELWRRAVVHLSGTGTFGTLAPMRLRLAGLLFAISTPLVAQTSPESLLMQQSAGTSRNPAAAPMSMLSTSAGSWMLHAHALGFLSHIDGSGSREDKKTFSTNWFMGSAMRSFGSGALQGFYGERPRTVLVYLRARLGSPEGHAHQHHGM
jgi:hypothetical protein